MNEPLDKTLATKIAKALCEAYEKPSVPSADAASKFATQTVPPDEVRRLVVDHLRDLHATAWDARPDRHDLVKRDLDWVRLLTSPVWQKQVVDAILAGGTWVGEDWAKFDPAELVKTWDMKQRRAREEAVAKDPLLRKLKAESGPSATSFAPDATLRDRLEREPAGFGWDPYGNDD